jgi:hypothetical protein
MLAKAMGANVTAISHSHNKQADAEKMGAANFIAISDEGAFEKNRSKLDLIISTTNDPKMPLDGYLSLLKPHGYLIFVRVSVSSPPCGRRPDLRYRLACPNPPCPPSPLASLSCVTCTSAARSSARPPTSTRYVLACERITAQR